jgi:polar amino acid transport system substrate-binding protein
LRRILLRLLACAALVLVTPWAAGATGSPVLSRIVKSGVLRVGMSGNQPPLNMTSQSGEMIGMEVDLAGMLARSMNVKLEVVRKPFAELLDALQKGQVDLVMSGLTITPERNLKVAFVGPYFVSGKSMLTKSRTLAAASDATSIDDPSVSLAALAGSTSQKFVETVAPKAKLVAVQDYDEGVQAVIGDQVDALVADYPICVLSVLRHPDQGLATLVSPLTIEPIGIAVPADDTLLLNLVQNYVGALQLTGAMEALRSKWFDDGSWLSQLP